MIVDLFAGGGGASAGIEAATGRRVDVAINHSALALAVHGANHGRTQHLVTDVWDVDPNDVVKGRPVELLWASPDCTHFSSAKGGVPRSANIRSLADVVIVWAAEVRPTLICLENVQEFQGWGPLGEDGRPDKARAGEDFRRWKRELGALGYLIEHRVLDASKYGAPTKRRRLFLVARCDGLPIIWPEPTHGAGILPLQTAADCIDWSLPCPSIFGRAKPLADKTLARLGLGIRRFVLENPTPFMVERGSGHALIQTGYGERKGQAPRVLDLNEPLGTVMAGGAKHALVTAFIARHFGGPRPNPGIGPAQPLPTITAQDHHSLVNVSLDLRGARVPQVRAFLTAYYGSDGTSGQEVTQPMRTITAKHRLGLVTVAGSDFQIVDIGMRMLEPHELLRAQFGRFAAQYDMSAAKTKSAKIRLIGNSVCPEVAEALVRANWSTQAARAA